MTKNVNHVQSNDFLENVIKEKKELEESMKESFRQRDERKKREKEKTESEKMQEELEPLPYCPMSDE